jgi:hypothetical protein
MPVLPPEVLSNTFMHAYPPPSSSLRTNLRLLEEDGLVSIRPGASQTAATTAILDAPEKEKIVPKPIVLGAVCSHWRQLAWGTPELWSALDPRPLPVPQQQRPSCGFTQAMPDQWHLMYK